MSGSEPTVGETLPAPAPSKDAGPAVGDTIGRYVIERSIGAGAMGVVYAATDPELGRKVAVKLLRRGVPTARLKREAQALAKLSHPNVVAIHDVGDLPGGGSFIAMALVDGDNLRTWLETPRETAAVLDVIRHAARGIVAAHAAGLVHRDLKPDNIFVARDGGVLVGDFGLAREDGAPDTSETGMMLGTPAYMAPEQAAGDATMQSDQFSLCVTAWEALFGSRPFVGANHAQLLDSIEQGTFAPIARPRPLSKHAMRALRRGLSADPAERFPSAAAFLRAFDRTRGRWPLFVAGGAALVGAGVAIALVARGGDPEGPTCGHELAIWDVPATKAAITTKLGASGPAVIASIDQLVSRWRALAIELCAVATPRQATCLVARASDLLTLIVELPRVDPMTAALAVAHASDPAACRTIAGPPVTLDPARYVKLSTTIMGMYERRAKGERPTDAELGAVLAEARAIGEPQQHAGALRLAAEFAADATDYARAETVLREAIAVADAAREDSSRADAAAALARLQARLGRPVEARQALEVARAAWARFGSARDNETLVEAEAMVARVAGDYATAAAGYERLAAIAHQRYPTEPILEIAIYDLLAPLYLQAQLPARASDARMRAEQLRETAGIVDDPMALMRDAQSAMIAGEHDRAIALHERFAQRMAMADPRTYGSALQSLGMAYELAARYANVEATYLLAVAQFDLVPGTETLPDRAFVLEGIGRARLALGRPAQAEEPLRTAIALATAPGFGDTSTTASLALGEVLLALGQPAKARVIVEPILARLDAEAANQPRRRGGAAYTLAQALWVTGTATERDRARVLIGDAIRDLEAAATADKAQPMTALSAKALEAKLVAARAWRSRHP